jgi:hypothetical protein
VKIPKERVKIVAFSDEFKTIGTAHSFPEERFSDFIDTLQKGYISLTDAKVYSVRTRELLYEAKFMKLNLIYLKAIMPLSDYVEKKDNPNQTGVYTIE